MEERLPFSPPVRVCLDPRGRVTRAVSSTREAAECLLDDWPQIDGSAALAAREACLAAMEGRIDADVARRAFIAAAEAAGVLRDP
jgi:hypothetical protein